MYKTLFIDPHLCGQNLASSSLYYFLVLILRGILARERGFKISPLIRLCTLLVEAGSVFSTQIFTRIGSTT